MNKKNLETFMSVFGARFQERLDLTLLEWALVLCIVCVIGAGVADLYRFAGGLFGT